jgi:hypothetical protein
MWPPPQKERNVCDFVSPKAWTIHSLLMLQTFRKILKVLMILPLSFRLYLQLLLSLHLRL